MIIDLIVDRKVAVENGKKNTFNAHDFYYDIRGYEEEKMGVCDNAISLAMDYGENRNVQVELCRYLYENEYNNPDLISFVLSQNWIETDPDYQPPLYYFELPCGKPLYYYKNTFNADNYIYKVVYLDSEGNTCEEDGYLETIGKSLVKNVNDMLTHPYFKKYAGAFIEGVSNEH